MLEEILKLINGLLPVLKPSQYDSIIAEIEKLRKEKHEKRERFKKAVEEMDVDTINAISDSFFE
jgi:formate dehydrogenase maturation protein FdhE